MPLIPFFVTTVGETEDYDFTPREAAVFKADYAYVQTDDGWRAPDDRVYTLGAWWAPDMPFEFRTVRLVQYADGSKRFLDDLDDDPPADAVVLVTYPSALIIHPYEPVA